MFKKVTICVVLLSVMTGCTMNTKKTRIVEVASQEIITKLNDADQNTFLLFLTSDSCYTCDEYMKVLKKLQKKSPFDIYYLKIDLSETNHRNDELLAQIYVKTGDVATLPMTYYFYQGNLLDENKREGYIALTDYEKWLKELHIWK